MPDIYTYDTSSFAGRLNTAMDAAGYHKVRALAQDLAIGESSVRAWLAGRAKFPGAQMLASLAQLLRVNERWLATGEGSSDIPGEDSAAKGNSSDARDGFTPTQSLAIETLEDVIRSMTDEQVLEFHRELRKIAKDMGVMR